MIPEKSDFPDTGKCMVFLHLMNGFVMPCPVDLQQALAEQMLDMEDVCGQFPKDAYFVHGGKPVVLDKPFQEQGIVGDCNVKVLLRLRGGGGGKEGAGEGEHSENAPQTNEAELQDLSAKLDNITDGKPEEIEVEVRALYSEINSLEDTYDKKKLLTKLTAMAIRGLQEDLQNLLKENGLSDMALQLVCDYTTRQIDLAKKLYQAEKYGTKQDEFYIVPKFYKTAKSSGLSIAASVTSRGWGFHASASGAHSSQSSRDTSTKKQRNTTHATVTQYICQPTKAFRVPLEDMELNYEARSHAKEIKDKESAQNFFKMYGSHVPKGVHTLGGVFFRNLDVNTEREASVSEVMMAAGREFDTEVSAGYSGFGVSVGGSVKKNSFKISGSTDASSTKKVKFMSEMTVQVLGPPTTNPEMFSQLLQSNNATWYVIDRGDRAALVPVWELMHDLKKQAEILKEVWKESQDKFRDKYNYPFYPIKGKVYPVEEELLIDLASEGVPDQATEVIVYVTISMTLLTELRKSDIPKNVWMWSPVLESRPEVELIVSTNSPNGVIERKVYCRGGEQVQSCNSDNISLPVACNGDRIVRIFFKDQYQGFAVASVQIVGYYRKR